MKQYGKNKYIEEIKNDFIKDSNNEEALDFEEIYLLDDDEHNINLAKNNKIATGIYMPPSNSGQEECKNNLNMIAEHARNEYEYELESELELEPESELELEPESELELEPESESESYSEPITNSYDSTNLDSKYYPDDNEDSISEESNFVPRP